MGDLGSQTITVVDAPLVTDSRTKTESRDWNLATFTDIPGCSVQPFILAEKLNYTNDNEREFTKNSFRVYAPPEIADVITPECRVLYNNVDYEVQGIPGPWYDLDGSLNHVAFLIRERRG